jgi:hypothetical protein
LFSLVVGGDCVGVDGDGGGGNGGDGGQLVFFLTKLKQESAALFSLVVVCDFVGVDDCAVRWCW